MNNEKHSDGQQVVVIGAGQAGFSVCSKLRALGFEGNITLVGDEAHPPYQRPPLSKAYLLGSMPLERLLFRPESYYSDERIELIMSKSAEAIDRAARDVCLSDGTRLPYDQLVIATGASPVTLPAEIGGNLAGIHYVRGLADADRMKEDVKPGQTVLVVGGGYIGLEAAAVAAKSGMKVILVEAAERILQRVASPETSDYFRQLHRANGVDIRENVMLEEVRGVDGRVVSARLSDGSEITVDCVIVGIGIKPNQALAEAAGLEIENGICVDAHCRTSDPDIFAVGDCASFPYGRARIRLESVGNAVDQGELVARVLVGDDVTYEAKPWFWSDQYDVKLQIVGIATGYDRTVTRDTGNGAVSFWYFAKDRLLAVDAINDPRSYMVAKRLIEGGKSPSPDIVSNPNTDLKTLLR